MSLGRRRRPRPRELSALADEELVRLAAAGDEHAFEVVYGRHSAVAYALAYRMMGAEAAAQDVLQDAFLSLWRTGARYDPTRASVRTWVLAIVHHRAIDALRRTTRRGERSLEDERPRDEPVAAERTEAEVLQHEQAAEIRDALDDLPDEQRRVIELAYFGGFTHTEIAALLDAPVGTVKGRMRLGLEKLRSTVVTSPEGRP